MPRPEFISAEDIKRWDETISNSMHPDLAGDLLFKEVVYAGQWLGEQLTLLECDDVYIVRILYTAGQMSFGRDPWEVSFALLNAYRNNELVYEDNFSVN